MSRASSYPLLILERLDFIMGEDLALHPDLWATPLATFTIRPTAKDSEAPRPYGSLMAEGSDQQDGSSVDGHRDLMHVTAYLETASVPDPQAAGLELASDFRRFLDRHRQLEADDGLPWLVTGQIQDRGFALAVDFGEGGAGGALIEFKLDVEYQWSGTSA